jgi:fructokinase
MYGAIEAGGTKFICAVAADPLAPPVETLNIPTTTPAETLRRALDFFAKHQPLQALGIGSFGPVDLRHGSPTYGYITATPKPGWRNTPFVQPLRDAFNVPVGFDTDVNGAALGEWCYGAGQGLESIVYFTIGTGIGGGLIINRQLVHGLVHPEMGHFPMHRHPQDIYGGYCSYHRDCFEGMACGPALADRWGKPASELPPDHQAWEFEAYYIAQAIRTVVCALSPQRVILGGGVMHQAHLFPLIRRFTAESLNGYIQDAAILEHIDQFIVPPGLGDRAGIVGALELARRAASI